ncbi:MAG: TonB-dependent receptor [Candidatus Marinimicrobia bacterium]|nr:TonB-dependent receptor [Candidatus Neomarinimicrobiota bacterium]MCF7905471.1 TonB-dependent receptor [Candidatus Neomarinimicrobiota bacterium]
MNKRIIILYILLQLSTSGFAQSTGSLQGTITDSETGEALIGANVIVLENNTGSATDLEGYYFVQNIRPGVYTLRVSYIGYKVKDIVGVEIIAGISTRRNIVLDSEALSGEEVIVQAETTAGSALASLQDRQNSSNMENAVSAEEMSRSGDSNAADALKRLPGVSVREGKFPIVRGLGERYTSTQMNSAPIPSPEPDKKSVPLDLFPSALLESIVALKTFTPDLPGVFAGGSINIKTKAYPDERLINFKASASDHTSYYQGLPFNLTYKGSKDFFGYDDGTRALSANIPDDQILSTASNYRPQGLNTVQWYGQISDYSRASNPTFVNYSPSPGRPISLGFDLGDEYELNDNLEYGFFTNLVFKNDYKMLESETAQFSMNSSTTDEVTTSYLEPYTERTNQISEYKTNLGGNVSAGLKYKDNHKLKIQSVYTHTSSDKNTISYGYTPNIESGVFIRNHYIEKTIVSNSISGVNTVVLGPEHKFDWSINRGESTRFEPDNASHNYSEQERYAGTDSAYTYYVIDRQAQKIAYRDFTDGVDRNASSDLNYEMKIPLDKKHAIKIKTGLRLQEKAREFEKRSFAITNSSSSAWNDSVLNIYPDMDFGQSFGIDNFFSYDSTTGDWEHGLIMLDETAKNAFNGYRANEETQAYYAMASIPLMIKKNWSLQFEGGARFEDYQMNLDSYNPINGVAATTIYGDTASAKLDQEVVLPSLNLIYNREDGVSLRAAFSQTVGRPEFRELAPIAYQEFYQGEVAIGYPFLKNASVSNFDLRSEWYPSASELFSVGFFYKEFENPIEVSMISTVDLAYKTFQNARKASTFGLELELRKKLPIPLTMGYGTISLNTTISESEVSLNDTVYLFNGTSYANSVSTKNRPLQGQSRAMYNAGIDYHSPSGYMLAFTYNSFTKRIASVGVGEVGDIYEFPFHSLNMSASKSVGSFKFSMKIKNILNSKVRFGHLEEPRGDIKLRKVYSPGLSLSLGVKYQLKQIRS